MLAVESQTTHYPTNNLLVCTSGHKLAISSLKQQNEKKEKEKKEWTLVSLQSCMVLEK